MGFKTRGIVLSSRPGKFYLEFTEDAEAFLQANVGKEVEVEISATSRNESRTADVVKASSHKKVELSPCASARYWQVKDEKKS